jgi:flagellar motor switch/type III secretory pathway protein FliN
MKEPMPLEVIAGGNRDAMIDEAQVQVLVSFPAFTLPVGEANALREGYVVDLGVSLAQARMTVIVSGEEVAEGRLMVAGSHAAVLLLSMR